MEEDYKVAQLPLHVARPTRTRADAGASPGRRGRRRPGRSGRGDRSGAARHHGRCCSTTTTRSRPAPARSASPSARWRSSTGSAAASAWSTRACAGTSARCSSGDELVYRFDLLPEAGHQRPAFINLQQYYVEGFLVERARDAGRTSTCAGRTTSSGVDAARRLQSTLTVETPGRHVRGCAATIVVACRRRAQPDAQLLGLEARAAPSATAS